MPELVTAYLQYHSHGLGDGSPPQQLSDKAPLPVPRLRLSNVQLIDMFTQQQHTLNPMPDHQYPNEVLVSHGYLGMCTYIPQCCHLNLCPCFFRQAHRTCPQYSIQSFCQTLCHMHQVPYHAYLTKQLSVAYDVYLEILHCVDNQLKKAMGWDTPNWWLLNACPACCYKLKNEPSLDFEWLVSIDSNNFYGITPCLDTRHPRSDYWIDPDGVNNFQHEVNLKPMSTYPSNSHDDWEDEPSDPYLPKPINCVDQWCNAGPEYWKHMFSVFCESGIFIAVCWHHFILLACDMIKSSEL
ncbi:hypothetical protein SCLCIDRAFT_13660 [Scleroderma citrinum Foug A]|uniref:CxC1-like cysteine cluster associated with KDZ transposases domain-containing protein n=1 Tax=Scleroderma citrinum Foug A TaxID=1036808 RepID=A0A0C3ATP6_9AGAM|nr:hypothetical protein SCLCIDRAFT_13660 [Scleroderma citrinum Foug A]